MGPRPDGRGKGREPPAAGAVGSVNGAAARRPRKDIEGCRDGRWAHKRQWGRGQTAAESGGGP